MTKTQTEKEKGIHLVIIGFIWVIVIGGIMGLWFLGMMGPDTMGIYKNNQEKVQSQTTAGLCCCFPFGIIIAFFLTFVYTTFVLGLRLGTIIRHGYDKASEEQRSFKKTGNFNPRYCSKCGDEISSDSAFCSNCGKRV